jgi:LytS/YehU family sensor histidine kinase
MREVEKTRISSRISELEQLALKSQMNPHFIFNSLNSIQQYVMDKDIAGANRFISGFSKLIRQTLDFSSKPLVNLTDEIGYLSTYLELEKNRLEDKFTFTVSVDEELKNSDYQVPPMILQPYLENSLRHGIRFRKDNEGRISVRVNKMENRLVCVIEDNGVGRKLAAHYKSINPIEYQSKGMSLTADRLELINRNIKDKIYVSVDDLVNKTDEPAGTRVTISFPDVYI